MKYNVTKNDTDTDINIDINIDIDARIFNDIGTNYSDIIFIVDQILHWDDVMFNVVCLACREVFK